MRYLKKRIETEEYVDLAGEEGILVLTHSPSVAGRYNKEGVPVLGILGRDGEGSFEGIPYLVMEPLPEDVEYYEQVYRRYRKLPWEILVTERTRLRETVVEDVPEFYRMYEEPSITRYMEGLFEDMAEEVAYTIQYRENIYELFGFGIWTVLDRETGELIGRAGITSREGFEEPEIGFVIRKDRQKEGIAFEVCNALLSYAKEVLEFDVITAFVMPQNVPSVRLLEKLGMKPEGEYYLGTKKHIRYRRML